MEVRDQFHPSTACGPDNIINVPFVELWYKAGILVRDLSLEISNEEAHVVWTHLATHGDSSYLLVELAIKCEGVEGQHKFCKMH